MSFAGVRDRTLQAFDCEKVRAQFPVLQEKVHGQPLVYLDNAATTQKPKAVIDALKQYYQTYNSNVHRGAHALSDRATEEFESARGKVARFINSPRPEQVIWTRGTTEAINLVASTWGKQNIQIGDRILVSTMEHHSNIVPWQLLAQQTGAEVLPIAVNEAGELDLENLQDLLDERVKLVAITHVSNALGTINPIKKIIELAHAFQAKVLIDGAQAVTHFPVDVHQLDADFYAFSGHKLFGPTGIGVLWGNEQLLDAMPPYQAGGEMIEHVSFTGTTFNELPYKFEAGTPHIAGAIGLGVAIDFLESFDRAALAEHEQMILDYATEKALGFEAFKIIGRARKKTGVLSFVLGQAHPADVGALLDQQGVAVRTGHHCTQPLMEYLGLSGTVRASFSIYNTKSDVDRFFMALKKAREFLD